MPKGLSQKAQLIAFLEGLEFDPAHLNAAHILLAKKDADLIIRVLKERQKT